MRAKKVYEPEERRYVPNNLYCHYCGNTHQWQIDLRLNYELESSPKGLLFNLESVRTKRIISAIEKNIHQMVNRSYDREKPIFHCANCQNEILDIHERSLEMCWAMDCPGCFDCGEWIDKETTVIAAVLVKIEGFF